MFGPYGLQPYTQKPMALIWPKALMAYNPIPSKFMALIWPSVLSILRRGVNSEGEFGGVRFPVPFGR